MQTYGTHSNSLVRLREHLLDVAYIAALGVRSLHRTISGGITEIGVRALVVHHQQVLLVRHRVGFFPWGLPGGAVNKRESLVAAVQREVQEEAGCPVRIERLQGVFHFYQWNFNTIVILFVCTPLAEPRPPVGDIEIIAARYVNLNALPSDTDRASRARIAEYMRGEASLFGAW